MTHPQLLFVLYNQKMNGKTNVFEKDIVFL